MPLINKVAFREKIEWLILGKFDIINIDGYYKAFEAETANTQLGKYLMVFK